MQIKSKNAILTQKQLAKQVRCADSTLTRFRNDMKMISYYRSSENHKGLKKPQKKTKNSSSLVEIARRIT